MHRRFPHNNIISLLMLILLLSLAAYGSEGESSTTPARPPGPLAQAFQSHLLLVKDAVAAIVNPETSEPTVIPDFDCSLRQQAASTRARTPGKMWQPFLRSLAARSTSTAKPRVPIIRCNFRRTIISIQLWASSGIMCVST